MIDLFAPFVPRPGRAPRRSPSAVRVLHALVLGSSFGLGGCIFELGGSQVGDSTATGGADVNGCSAQAAELIELVNEYRAQNGLAAIPASPSLCRVGETHVGDLADNRPDADPGCNLHSWSGEGSWSACCYTEDHAEAQCMWDKPRELTDYPGNGYENAHAGVSTPEAALAGWKGSPGHNAVILNQDAWEDHPWGALGAGLNAGYAVLWFGEESDPEG